MIKSNFKFVDLFSGIGGFHQALSDLGGTCVFASEIDKYAIQTYMENYGINSECNIRKVQSEDIPDHDVLCAGFPCVAFSIAGKREGFKDLTRGTLFFEVVRILEYHRSKYIILENVRNLICHDHGNTWKVIRGALRDLGYRLTEQPIVLSPHQFGVPQLRERVIILGIYDPSNIDDYLSIRFDNLLDKNDNNPYSIIDENNDENDKYRISDHEEFVLSAWDEFYKGLESKIKGFPIWTKVWKYKKVPDSLPRWKEIVVKKNIDLYYRNNKFIDSWLSKFDNLKNFTDTEKKLEWQAGDSIDTIWDGLIQYRESGIRVKRPNCYPALVAMVQTPIVAKFKRRLSPREVGRLQSFPDSFVLNQSDQQAYKQFGNAVNVTVIRECAKKLFEL